MSQRRQLTHAVDHLVDQILGATMAFVLVYLNTLATHMLAVDQNVYSVQTVQMIRHAYETNALILAQVLVGKTVYVT